MTTTTATEQYPDLIAATKAHAAREGITGRKGGWLYTATGRPLCQGWANLAGRLVRHGIIRDLDHSSLATREGDVLNGRLRRNAWDRRPVLLTSTRP